MASPTTSAVRNTILISDTTVLTDTIISQFITDAETQTGATDELALRYYTAYLIAQVWDTIGGVSSAEGISFFNSQGEKFLKLYNDRIKQINLSTGNSIGMVKITTNPDLAYDTTYNYLRERKGSDNYY